VPWPGRAIAERGFGFEQLVVDPCPCGSSKKYKQCCLLKAGASMVEKKDHDGAIERAMAWLGERHRKTFGAALDELLAELLDEEGLEKLEHLDEQTWSAIQVNLMEWLLAEGELSIKVRAGGCFTACWVPEGRS
jgi:SEC-C motif-containing protein